MESVIFTPRLKLTLVTTAERGSKELEWLHELRSDEKVTWWSLSGRSKSLEDTEKVIEKILPKQVTNNDEDKTFRIPYAVHELLPTTNSNSGLAAQNDRPSRFIGLITLQSLESRDLVLPPHLFPDSTQSSPNVLTIEVGYQYLPVAWGKGYGTESVGAVFDACKRAPAFWNPYEKVFVRAIVNAENPASQRVMAKVGMPLLGIYEWNGEAIYIAGQWREKDELNVYGMFLVE
ncbi:GNAT family acetyltransferas-like protein [Plenodomus tracheiphilus IPT5]|uniref:GNAT family acetyltransferas-like protein n=1 Tax=Plenodomus tracheiphilus IPT5 TaxID=1408161 RepID=A0A6A7B9L7_9PLEO|nr:GNAT family acetyltransferas-like protein [Plenodomus tracheiphilus IPT5]